MRLCMRVRIKPTQKEPEKVYTYELDSSIYTLNTATALVNQSLKTRKAIALACTDGTAAEFDPAQLDPASEGVAGGLIAIFYDRRKAVAEKFNIDEGPE